MDFELFPKNLFHIPSTVSTDELFTHVLTNRSKASEVAMPQQELKNQQICPKKDDSNLVTTGFSNKKSNAR